MLLAANHPNSFFDAVLLGALFKRPVHFLTRGDAFKNRFAKKLLAILKAIPIYRLQEGKENLSLNGPTFEKCYNIFKQGGIILIFSEGLCENQWQLRALKKGTARIAIQTWKKLKNANAFRVLPVGINYHSFFLFGKNIVIDFGEPVTNELIDLSITQPEQVNLFNKTLYDRIANSMVIVKGNEHTVKFLLSNPSIIKQKATAIEDLKIIQDNFLNDYDESAIPINDYKKIFLPQPAYSIHVMRVLILFVPAMFSLIIHLPLYLPVKYLVRKITAGSVFYDSVLYGSLFILYPLYVLLLSLLCLRFGLFIALLAPPVILLLAWSAIIWRDSTTRLYNVVTSKSAAKLFNNLYAGTAFK